MTALAEDLLASVLIDGVVARQKDAVFRHEVVKTQPARPRASRQEDQRRCEKTRW
jgi:hypothetical protein